MTSVYLADSQKTHELGVYIGRRLKPGSVLALVGDLGAGKTHLTKGLAEGLEVPSDIPVVSPTFTLAYEYPGRIPLFHLDLYRLSAVDWELSGLDEYLERGGVTVIEWADRLQDDSPEVRLEINLTYTDDGAREAEIIGFGARYEKLILDIRACIWANTLFKG